MRLPFLGVVGAFGQFRQKRAPLVSVAFAVTCVCCTIAPNTLTRYTHKPFAQALCTDGPAGGGRPKRVESLEKKMFPPKGMTNYRRRETDLFSFSLQKVTTGNVNSIQTSNSWRAKLIAQSNPPRPSVLLQAIHPDERGYGREQP